MFNFRNAVNCVKNDSSVFFWGGGKDRLAIVSAKGF